ncbi:MAG: TIGR00725 family protein [Desulfarculus sp.]|nr:TIGR00725 family protein [Desulfarculus sp.]
MTGVEQARLVSVIGAGQAGPEALAQAQEVGRLLAAGGYGVVTGGLGGVMEAAARGAASAGGLTLGILPGLDPQAANPWCRVVIPSGLGQARNVLVVLSGLGVVAVSGGAGTLSEIGHALKVGKPVAGLSSWPVPGVFQAAGPEEAVEYILKSLDTSA